MSNEYKAFLKAYDDIDIKLLSDDELQKYCDLCHNGVIEAYEELRKRGLWANTLPLQSAHGANGHRF